METTPRYLHAKNICLNDFMISYESSMVKKKCLQDMYKLYTKITNLSLSQNTVNFKEDGRFWPWNIKKLL